MLLDLSSFPSSYRPPLVSTGGKYLEGCSEAVRFCQRLPSPLVPVCLKTTSKANSPGFFTISVYGNSFFCFFFDFSFYICTVFASHPTLETPKSRLIMKWSPNGPKKRELHELLYTEMVKSGIIRLASHTVHGHSYLFTSDQVSYIDSRLRQILEFRRNKLLVQGICSNSKK